jgi:aspartate kinase
MISAEPEVAGMPVCGAAKVKNEARVTVRGVPDRPGAALTLFSQIAAKKVAMDMIVQNVGEDGRADISFTVVRDDLPTALKAVEEATRQLEAEGYTYDDDVSKVSVVGAGMATQSGVAHTMFRALADQQINIQMITTSEIKISVLVDRAHSQQALRTVHEAFQLDREPADRGPANANGLAPARRVRTIDAAEVVARMNRMEDLTIEDITRDDSQAWVKVVGLPDAPGLAARLFEEVAAGGILVDMIVQTTGRRGHANITFTTPQKDVEAAMRIVSRLAEELGCPPPISSPTVTKLSVFGIGMRSHTGVAQRMFHSLAAAGVNVQVISTSEVRVNVVVDAAEGERAMEALRREFADSML